MDESEGGDLQIRLEQFFNKYANTNAVRMRRYDDDSKAFKVCLSVSSFRYMLIRYGRRAQYLWNSQNQKV